MDGSKLLMAQLLYGTGMRLNECLTLRVLDVDFDRNEIIIRNGKGAKDRRTMIPKSLVNSIKKQIQIVKILHEKDLLDGFGKVCLPDSLDKKYPNEIGRAHV